MLAVFRPQLNFLTKKNSPFLFSDNMNISSLVPGVTRTKQKLTNRDVIFENRDIVTVVFIV